MFRPRVIPCLLLKNLGLVKSVKFKDFRYIGDPINAVKIFNDKKADELVFLDITASDEKRNVSLKLIKDIGDECNMPFSVGGGIRTIENIKEILNAGAEKVCINSYAFENPEFIRKASETFGSSTIVISIDVKKNIFGKQNVYIYSGTKNTGVDAITHAFDHPSAPAEKRVFTEFLTAEEILIIERLIRFIKSQSQKYGGHTEWSFEELIV